MTAAVDVVVFEGGGGPSPVEQWFRRVRQAIALDVIERLAGIDGIGHIIVCTDDEAWLDPVAPSARHRRLLIALDDGGGTGWGSGLGTGRGAGPAAAPSFHWGRRLWHVVQEHRLERVVVMGGASAPLLTESDMAAIVHVLQHEGPGVWANNVHSADIIAFTPASVLGRIDLPAADNALPYRLRDQGGLPLRSLPLTLGLTFDVDTPTDALILALHPRAGSRVKKLLAEGSPMPFLSCEAGRLHLEAGWLPSEARRPHSEDDRPHSMDAAASDPLDVLRRAGAALMDRWAEVWIAGRVGGHQLRLFDEMTRCRLRVFSELRGLKSLGLLDLGAAVSLMATWIDAVGPEAFFRQLASVCDAAFIDTRPLFAHGGRRVSTADRFASDLFAVDSIQDPWVRRWTAAARDASIPVVLGGHSLVTGGLWALLDAMAEGS